MKAPKRLRQWMNRRANKTDRKATREDHQNFWRHQTRGYEKSPRGVAVRKRHEKNRAKAKRSKQARKKNR